MKKIEKIVFIESSRSLGGSMICLANIRAGFSETWECHVITNHRECFLPVLSDFSKWHVLRAPMNIQQRRGLNGLVTDLIVASKYVYKLYRLKPSLVYLNNDTYSNRHAAIAAWLLNIPYVMHARGDIFPSRLSRVLLTNSRLNIGVSRYIKHQLDAISGITIKNVCLHDGVNVKATTSQLEEPSTSGTIRFAHIGNFVGWKGQLLALKAFKQMAEIIDKQVEITFFGSYQADSDEFRQCESFVEASNMEDSVVFAGLVHNVTASLTDYHIVLNTSTLPEPFGLTIIEGMQLGKVVIGPEHGGPMETIEHERSGILFRPNDKDSLVEAMIKGIELSKNDSFRVTAMARGNQFTIAPMLERLEFLLRTLEGSTRTKSSQATEC